METLLKILNVTMTQPVSYGWFHFLFVGIVIAVTLFLCIRYRDCDDRTFRRILLIIWLTIVVLEIYKEFIHLFHWTEAGLSIDYAWYIFPFQFCSTPFYILPFVIFCREGGLRRACTAFTALFALFAGLAVFVYPEGVFVPTVGIDIQTMVHHGSQIVVGIFVCARYRRELDRRFYAGAVAVFTVMVAIAQIMNELFFLWKPDTSFNMFYISRHWDCPLPLLSLIYPLVDPAVFAVMYLLGFCACAFLVWKGAKGFAALANRKKCLTNGE